VHKLLRNNSNLVSNPAARRLCHNAPVSGWIPSLSGRNHPACLHYYCCCAGRVFLNLFDGAHVQPRRFLLSAHLTVARERLARIRQGDW